MIRLTAPVYPEQPYNWEASSAYQCTWYAFYRAIEEGYSAPCYWDRETKTGSYTNAKDWLKNFREPWEVKGPNYKPVHGDIAVFTGVYGHVVFIEEVEGDIAKISDYNRVARETFGIDSWIIGGHLEGCGDLIGYLHYPYDKVSPVERDESRDQIRTTDESLRIRLEPNLNGKIFGNVQLGYYNVLSISEADNYTWYEIEKGKYCADITTVFLPKEDSELELLKKENEELKEKLRQINLLSEV